MFDRRRWFLSTSSTEHDSDSKMVKVKSFSAEHVVSAEEDVCLTSSTEDDKILTSSDINKNFLKKNCYS